MILADINLRQMCANWCCIHYPDEIQKLDIFEYQKLIYDLYNQVKNFSSYNEMVYPIFEKYDNINENVYTVDILQQAFDEIQTIYFKILDIIDNEKKLQEDFI